MPYLEVQGIRIYYAARVGGVKNLIFLHGAGGNHLNWYYQLKFLKDSFNLYALDLPGHGNSEGTPCDSIPCYAEFLSKFIKKIGAVSGDLILIGHSMGGLIIEEYLKNGGTCAGVVLISSSYRVRKKNSPRNPVEFCQNLFYTMDAIEGCLKTANMILARSKDVLKHDLEAASKVNYKHVLHEFNKPFLLIHGEKDVLIPLRDAELMDNLLPRSRLHVIKDAGHMVMIEKAREVSNVMMKWISELKEV